MGLLRRKQGSTATARAVAHLMPEDRELGMDMLEAAESHFVNIRAPSRLGTALWEGVASTLAGGVDERRSAVLLGAALLGYACRMAGPGRQLPPRIAASLREPLPSTEAGQLDLEGIDGDRLYLLAQRALDAADDEGLICTLAACSSGAWEAFSSVATFQLHRNLSANGLSRRQLPEPGLIEVLLRLGYVLRLIDELAGLTAYGEQLSSTLASPERPASRKGWLPPHTPSHSPPSPAEAEQIDNWLNDAAGVCISDFERFTERLLEMATIDLIGRATVFDQVLDPDSVGPIGEDVVTAMSNARFGYALRNRELQILDRAHTVQGGEALCAELDARSARSRDGSNLLMLHDVVHDAIVYGRYGGFDTETARIPGASAADRREAIDRWAATHFGGDSKVSGRDITAQLVRYGYLLHRLFELRPELLEDWD